MSIFFIYKLRVFEKWKKKYIYYCECEEEEEAAEE